MSEQDMSEKCEASGKTVCSVKPGDGNKSSCEHCIKMKGKCLKVTTPKTRAKGEFPPAGMMWASRS